MFKYRQTLFSCPAPLRRNLLWAGMSLLFGLLSITSATTHAATSSAEIARLVEQQVTQAAAKAGLGHNPGERLEIQVQRPDDRLKLKDCGHIPTVAISSQRLIGRVTTKVSCEQPHSWGIYVPVMVNLYRPVWVASQPLPRGHRLTPADIKQQEHLVSRLAQGYIQQSQQIVGQELRRPLRMGQVFTTHSLQAPQIIHKGDDVMIIAKTGTLSIRTAGTALANGRTGQQINVRNKGSKRIVKARIVGKGLVEVAM